MRIIRKEILIEAPVAKVWEHITDPEKIAGWLMPNDFEAHPNKGFTLDCAEKGKISCVVKEIVPEKKLVYSFTSKDIHVETLVAITLAMESRATRVTLVHSGWDALPPSDQGIAGAFDSGWGSKLESLRRQIVGTATS